LELIFIHQPALTLKCLHRDPFVSMADLVVQQIRPHSQMRPFPGRNPRRQFIHEDDVAAAFILALFHDLPGAYNVVPDDCLRLNDVWKMVGVKFAPTLPLPLARWLTFLRWRFLGSPIHPSWVADMLMDFTGSNARLKQAGWTPRYGSAAALQSAVTGKNL